MKPPAAPTAPPDAATERFFLLGTAGHIDHGKTSLVFALTGTNPDRLPEEQRRGMTIELGFAELAIGDMRFGVVDVPGHERFVRTMVSGATGIDIVLLVVAADDSVMPQTVEHLEILKLLGIARGIVVITKIDMVDDQTLELVIDETRTLLAGTPLEAAPMCPVSSVTGAGLDHMRRTIAEVASGIQRSAPTGPFRLAIDRVFTVQGRGTVVTGSVLRGAVRAGDTLDVLPAGLSCRVRDLQAHGASRAQLERGQRCALNVSGIDRQKLERGMELATPGFLRPTQVVDVHLECLRSYGRPLKSTGTARLEIGTTEVLSRVVLIEGRELAPGQSGFAQLRSGTPLTAVYGQRFILRDENAARTIGGGVILRPLTRRRRRDAATELESLDRLLHGDDAQRLEEVLRGAGFAELSDLHAGAETGIEPDRIRQIKTALEASARWRLISGTHTRVVPAALDDLQRRLSGWLNRHHQKNPDSPGRPLDSVVGWLDRLTGRAVGRALIDEFMRRRAIKLVGSFVCLPTHAPTLPPADERIYAALVAEIRTGGFQPPELETLKTTGPVDRKRLERLAKLAVALGELVHIEGSIYLHLDLERQLRVKVAGLISETGGATVSQVREALGSSRKYVVPFVEYLDRAGVTKRIGDQRVLAK